MTVPNTINKVTYVGNGVATTFDFPFRVLQASDLTVTLTDISTGAETLLTGGYTVTGAGQAAGGTVAYPVVGPPLAATHRITLRRVMPVVQDVSISNQGGYFPTVHETVFDRLTMIDQQQQEQLDRCIKQSASESSSASLVLPPVAARAGRSVKFDAGGNLIVTQYDPDTLQAAAAASAAAAATSATAAAADRSVAETSSGIATAARDAAVASAAAAAAVAASIGQEMVEIITTNRTAVLADNGKVFAVNAAAGAVTVTLPPIATVGEPFRLTIKKTDSTANPVSVARSGTDTIDGGPSPLVLRVQGAGTRLGSDLDPSPDNWVSQAFGLAVGDATPIGMLDWFLGTTPPPGWVVADGSLMARATYPDLWAFVQSSNRWVTESAWQGATANRGRFSTGDGATTFRLPDLVTGNLFVRAQGPGAADFGRREEDDNKSHTHDFAGGGNPAGSGTAGAAGQSGNWYPLTTVASGGAEARPKNTGALPIIKAFSVPVDTKSIDVAALATDVGKKPLTPVAASGGQWVSVMPGTGNAATLPAGGAWAYFLHQINASTGAIVNIAVAGVAAGGTVVGAATAGCLWGGFAWRVQ